jgi:hypothetical protein
VARRHHRHAFDIQLELGEISHGREGEADIDDFGAAGQHPHHQRFLDGTGIGAEIMPRDDPHRHAAAPHDGGQPGSDRLNAH